MYWYTHRWKIERYHYTLMSGRLIGKPSALRAIALPTYPSPHQSCRPLYSGSPDRVISCPFGDSSSGMKVLWRGYRRLQDLAEMRNRDSCVGTPLDTQEPTVAASLLVYYRERRLRRTQRTSSPLSGITLKPFSSRDAIRWP